MEKSVICEKELFQGPDVLIIGNGFDLDLDLKTSYSNFYQSKYWPFNKPSTKMGEYLQKERERTNDWMDLEAKLGDYAYTGRYSIGVTFRYDLIQEKNQSDYELLIGRLNDYLKEAEKGKIKQDSIAAVVLKANLMSTAMPHIFSFNYTNLHIIADKLGINTEFNYHHVHGSLQSNNIILGVGENYSDSVHHHLPSEMDFLYKTSSPNYCPPQMADILNKATQITFFGLSLGGMDAPYFSGLFQNLSSEKGKSITFFTYDEKSRLQLLRHLRNVEAINLNDIWTRHSLNFICTSNPNGKSKVNEYIQNLTTRFGPYF